MWKDSETELDFLDFDHLIGLLDELIEDKSLLPSSVGVYGDWGSGKSSLIRMSMNKAAEKENNVCLIFNGWLFEGYEDAKTALMGSILDAIQENRTLTNKAKKCLNGLYKSIDKLKLLKSGIKYGGDFLLTGGIGSIASMTVQKVYEVAKGKLPEGIDQLEEGGILDSIRDELDNKEIRADIKKFQENFAELLAETEIRRLIIFIDELDRCNPDTILETLEAIRLFLFTGNTVFIIGADERHISYAVQRKFAEIEGQQINIGKEYLEKIIQYPIRIPRLSSKEMKFYITCLLLEKDLDNQEFKKIIEFFQEQKTSNFLDFSVSYDLINQEHTDIADKVKDSLIVAEQLSDVLAQGLNGNPRHCKRFLNSLIMREKMSAYKKMNLDRKVLAKIMMLEYFKPTLFKQLAEIQASEKGKLKELELLEKNELGEGDSLKIWKDDKWVQDWCKVGSKLSEIDLRAYFYFSRDTLTNKTINSSQKISPQAESILEKLLSKVEFSRNAAMKEAIEINDYESIEILQRIFTQLISETNINKDLLKSYLEWGKTKEILYTQVVSDLRSLSGNKISLSMVPMIGDYITSTKQLENFHEILIKWGEENEKIKNPLEKHIKRGE
ncbi:KAP family P-loop NTPase fold protein [Bacillus paranthracis]|uniref:KAP family P-loop NTPase fold protein n=1 Tax=Bacillus paranthracis TaxID=2026186 RepID=UPI0021CF2E46|nr:KAP family NTPase [Bacillus paranthracis]MCU5174632.1 KAP family NTPase [Bacillus paranthracis]